MWTTLQHDRAWWIFVAVIGFLQLRFVVPLFGLEGWTPWQPMAMPLSVSALLVMLLLGLAKLEQASERLFWRLTAAGYGCWWLAEVVVAGFGALRTELGFHFFIDCLYLLVFMFSLAAAEVRPDLGRSPEQTLPFKPRIEVAGTIVALVTFGFYFVLIPSRLDPQHYSTWINSSMLYAVLDALVALRFAQLAWIAGPRRWRVLYGLVALSLAIWFVLDTAKAMARASWFELADLSPLNILWSLPLLVVAAAARLRRHDFADAVDSAAAKEESTETHAGFFRTGSPLIVLAFGVPLMHNGLSASGLLLPVFQPARDWLVVAALAILAMLLVLEHVGEKARGRRERRRIRRDAQRDLENSEERFRRLAEASFEGVILHDGDRILDANEQLAAMFGYPLEQVIGSKVGSQVTVLDRERIQERLRQPGLKEAVEFGAYRSDRSKFFAEVRSRDLPSLGPEMRVAVLRDVTERRRLEDELRQAQKMEAVGQLAGGIAHDFNNLLTVILGTCDIASAETFDADIEQVRSAAERAADMTQQLLAFSRQQRLELEVLDVNGVVEDTEPLLRRLLPENIELVVELSSEIGPVRADRSQLSQVLMNLAINARDAMPKGGRLGLRTYRPQPSDGASGRMRLEISDRGAGIPAEDLGRIFEPFFTTKPRGHGTGLGLATVHGIVRQLGGEIDVDSKLGHGTVFRVDLPVVRGGGDCGDDAGPENAPELKACWGRGTILVVEDQPEICQLAKHFLSAEGFEVLCVHSGREAFAAAERLSQPARLLLVDVVLPEIGGPEIVEQLRLQWPEVKTLFMTGYTEGPWIEAIGDQPLLSKPFDRRRLLAAVRRVIYPADARARPAEAVGCVPSPEI